MFISGIVDKPLPFTQILRCQKWVEIAVVTFVDVASVWYIK